MPEPSTGEPTKAYEQFVQREPWVEHMLRSLDESVGPSPGPGDLEELNSYLVSRKSADKIINRVKDLFPKADLVPDGYPYIVDAMHILRQMFHNDGSTTPVTPEMLTGQETFTWERFGRVTNPQTISLHILGTAIQITNSKK